MRAPPPTADTARRPALGRVLPLALCVLLGVLLAGAQQADDETGGARPPRATPRVLVVDVAGVITNATADHLADALQRADRGRYDALLVRIDTPGGLLEATRRAVQSLLDAPVPVIAHVAPSGARAGSAGVFLVMAAHVAAMAPGTNLGAAHPVSMFGGGEQEPGGGVLAEKVVNDTAALLRAIAEERQRNVDWADAAVRESRSASAQEALDLDVIDLLAVDEESVLEAADGRRVQLPDGPATLRLAHAAREDFPMTVQQRALSVLGSPDVAYLLVMLGVLGLILEFYNPGLIVPAVLGALCLLLASIGLGVLPVNTGALVLLLLGVLFFVAEVAVVSFGLLSVAGIGCLLAGSLLLIDTSDPAYLLDHSVRVSWTLVLPTVVAVSGALVATLVYLARVHRRRGTTGTAALEGATGVARTAVDPSGGTVTLHGESWSAVSTGAAIPAGESVRVTAVDGLVLRVTSAAADRPSSSPADAARPADPSS